MLKLSEWSCSKINVVVGILITVFSLVVYWPVLEAGFVNYDDGAYVYENPYVKQGLTWDSISWAFSLESTEATGNWHPLTWLSLMADVSLFGMTPSSMHACNVVLHILNSLLIYGLFWRTTNCVFPSFFVAAIFAVHPAHVESVAWISERKDVLSTFLILLTLHCYLQASTSRPAIWHLCALFLFACSLMAKQMYVTLPFILICFECHPFRGKCLRLDQPTRWLPIIWKIAPYVMLSGIFCVIAFLGQQNRGAVGSLEHYPIVARMCNALNAYCSYVSMTFFPRGLAVFYPYPTRIQWGRCAVSSVFLLSLTSLFLWKWRKRPHLLFGWLWFLITLLPVIGLVQIGKQRMADRYLYFPMVGLLIAVGCELQLWTIASKGRKELRNVLTGACLGYLIMAGWFQTGYWTNSRRLFAHAIDVAESTLAHTKLGYEFAQSGQFREAQRHLRRALKLDPNYVPALSSMGNVYFAEGQFEQAERYFQNALELDDQNSEARFNLGIIATITQRPQEAIEHLEAAIRLGGETADVYANLGIAYAMIPQPNVARLNLEKAIELQPELPQAHFALGRLEQSQNRIQEAIRQFEIVLSLEPNFAPAVAALEEIRQKVDPEP